MTNDKAGGALAFGIMSKQGLSPQDIAALSEYLDSRQRAFVEPIINRIDEERDADRKIYRRDRKIALWVYAVSIVSVLSLPDQALLNGIKHLLSLIP